MRPPRARPVTITAPRFRDGRKPRAGVASSLDLAIRHTPDERARWQAAATAAGMTVGAWVRSRANAAALEGA